MYKEYGGGYPTRSLTEGTGGGHFELICAYMAGHNIQNGVYEILQ